MRDIPRGPPGPESAETPDIVWETYLASTLLAWFPASSIHAFVSKLWEHRGTALEAALQRQIILFMAVESGQRRLVNRLTGVLESVDADDPVVLMEGVVEVLQTIRQI